MSMIPTDDPKVIAEVAAQFERYETALVTNDVAVLDELFLNAPQTVRYGAAETLYGYDEIAEFRAGRDASRLNRKVTRVHIAAYGPDMAIAFCENQRIETGRRGLQSQTWIRTPDGWRVVAAHVSMLPEEG
tara:strand:- start:26598 stop:26990 length:393 start_codon:yes stop_codon:yes gene_type:complete